MFKFYLAAVFGITHFLPAGESEPILKDGTGSLTGEYYRKAAAAFSGEPSSNTRFAIDLSSRATYRDGLNEWAFGHFAGIDSHKVFSSPNGDWGTLTVQLYLTRLENQRKRPYFFEEEDDWELVTRITNFNFTGLSQGEFNIRVGHFEIPFGLEAVVNSNGTLRQLMTGPNLGVKADWGFGFNGTIEKIRYDLTLSRGTGNEYHSRNEPFALAGRIGTADDQETFTGTPGFGLSFFYGDILGHGGKKKKRSRLGVDAATFIGPFTLLGEISAGQDDNADVVNGFAEVNWVTPAENLTVYGQFRSMNRRAKGRWDRASSSAFGLRLTPDNSWALSAQVEQGWSAFPGMDTEAFYSVQARYRF